MAIPRNDHEYIGSEVSRLEEMIALARTHDHVNYALGLELAMSIMWIAVNDRTDHAFPESEDLENAEDT